MTVSVNGVWWIWATATQPLFRAKQTQQSQELNVPTIRRLADESLVCTLPTFLFCRLGWNVMRTKSLIFVGIFSLMLSDADSNSLSLSAAKTNTFFI